ncbi:hypothetical protein FEM48_Zijuj12G0018700 [Ziziphus jujuba var. spinosa]|uniref:Uncharacterized protein n=1 Tax=Ziziphus jujuba var. spinosa TaxID=714518 RepID=A0A978UAI4_ZIZJJ|nr:hypothetical protein FEM48_Zijuj12G0018700 [Ziziphus jujuba var. spinosa]
MKEEEDDEQEIDPMTFPKPKIQRVPPMLRDRKNFEKYFEPRAVSLGPLHHGKPNLQVAEKYKPKLTKRFIKDRGTDKGKDLYKKIWNNIKELRDCFDEEVTKNWDNETLAWMLFLDGCSTLQFIHSLVRNELKKFKIKNDQIAFSQQDLFLLENQLPYRLLKLLMNDDNNQKNSKNEYEESIKKFIGMHVMAPPKYMSKVTVNMEPEPAHLLGLLQSTLLDQPTKKNHRQVPPVAKEKKTGRREKEKMLDHKISYRNVQELKAAGIQLKPSGTFSLKEIDFNSLCFAERTIIRDKAEDSNQLMSQSNPPKQLLNIVIEPVASAKSSPGQAPPKSPGGTKAAADLTDRRGGSAEPGEAPKSSDTKVVADTQAEPRQQVHVHLLDIRRKSFVSVPESITINGWLDNDYNEYF